MEERRREKEEGEGRRRRREEEGEGRRRSLGRRPRPSPFIPAPRWRRRSPRHRIARLHRHPRYTAPRLSAFVPCMSLTAFVPYVDVWAFVPYVDVWAFVPYICCRPSCRLFSCRFWKPPRIGEVLPKFLTYSIIILLLQSRTRRRGPGVRRRPRSSSLALRSCLHSVASPLPR